ncbi:MAG: hypothetical protein GYA36_19250 [Veillonellaceae bacterium]|nr:hypothetical protein [Veillonellaceae bacterium]
MSELDKMVKAKEEHHTEEIGFFLDWLWERGIRLARWTEKRGRSELCLVQETPEQLIAAYVGVDLNQVEKEKRQLLDEIRRKG